MENLPNALRTNTHTTNKRKRPTLCVLLVKFILDNKLVEAKIIPTMKVIR